MYYEFFEDVEKLIIKLELVILKKMNLDLS